MCTLTCKCLLTLDIHDDSLDDGRGHSVAGDTEVGAHVLAADAADVEVVPIVRDHCNTHSRHIMTLSLFAILTEM